jgi:TonB family protein
LDPPLIPRAELEKHPDSASATAGSATRRCFLVSVILHLVLVVLWGLSEFASPPAGLNEPDHQEETNLVFELIEVPDYVQQEPPEAVTNLVSDRQTRAADVNPEDLPDSENPHTEGRVGPERYELSSADNASAEAQGAPEKRAEEELKLAKLILPEATVDYLNEMTAGRVSRSRRKSIGSKNLLSSSDRQDGISFNTYNWDFAPYMLAMKRKVESHLRPPYAFTHMGAVSGKNVIRFVVLPDGRVRDMEILESNAHISLDQTSLRAIQLSAPFLPLPRGFPEDYLEVTAHFAYIIGR